MRISLLVLGLLILSQFTFGQKNSFSHSIGITYFEGKRIHSFGLSYSPRINFLQLNKEITISAGTHLGAGFLKSETNAYVTSIDIPLMAEINFGHASSPENKSTIGGFGGIGVGLSMLNSSINRNKQKGIGIIFNVGVRALVFDTPLGLRVSYMINQWGDYSDILTITAYYTFGNNKKKK